MNFESFKEETSKPILVLDLDETLIKSAMIKTENASSHPIKIGRRRVFIQIRPGVSEFLKELSGMYEIYFFTAAAENYANQIIDLILPDTPKDHRFFKDSCSCICGYSVKDLTLIHHKQDRILLVDDMSGSGLIQPKNLIRITAWYGDKEDNVLTDQLLPLLKSIANEKDLPAAFQKIMMHKEKEQYQNLFTFKNEI